MSSKVKNSKRGTGGQVGAGVEDKEKLQLEKKLVHAMKLLARSVGKTI